MAITTHNTGRTIALATAVAGTLDILSACCYALLAGGSPIRMLRGVAGAILGAGKDSAIAPLVGLALHYAIMAVMVTVFVVAARRLPVLVARPIASGIGYGLLTWAVMNLVVLPLRWPSLFPKFTAQALSQQLFSHIVLVGVPIALIVNRRATR
ncbi:hypothetical protein QH494_20435 [Sphingomonas sp. AR_OL41]|jgi:uncharacterized membrane protein YagU involved in acid resistance|uniref:hypothetical protein n=1 Tax=Sphingomonas sp. AR_OL41 TaxID=3042729 RepID=UPI00247FFD38|nr:hypothetical protein [Sphingomonas sp. AR_OL41]MDH7974565.1 hypothetical protein [Sphingomonas sp. AR_OL41]